MATHEQKNSIHLNKLGQRLIFEKLISKQFLKDVSVGDLENLAYELFIIVSNMYYEDKYAEINNKKYLTDDQANSEDFIVNILFEKYYKDI